MNAETTYKQRKGKHENHVYYTDCMHAFGDGFTIIL